MALRAELVDAPVLDEELLRRAKHNGLSDRQIAALRPELAGEDGVRTLRQRLGIHPVYKTVDTCAAEFEAKTPYHYSSYELDPAAETEVAPQTEKPKVLILGSGPNRIGQGIEFDYSCVHAATTLRAGRFRDRDGQLQPGDGLHRLRHRRPAVLRTADLRGRARGLPRRISLRRRAVPASSASSCSSAGRRRWAWRERLEKAGVPIVGTTPEAIDLAEDRGAFGEVLANAGLPAPQFGMATSFEQARRIAADIGYPVLVRPSYVLGGRGMEIVYDDETLQGYITRATELSPEHPVLVDRFLDDAIEIDVDALCDGTEVYIGGVMEHIEEAGIHSGDSACALPPVTLGRSDIEAVRRATEAIAHGIGVVGLLNVQYALKDDVLYVLEANPRASRTVPFVSKATAVPLAKACARIMLGATIAELREEGVLARDRRRRRPPPATRRSRSRRRCCRSTGSARPTAAQIDSLLGPEMKSTGEVMGIDRDFGSAFAKSQTAAYGSLPAAGHGVRLGGQPRQALAGLPGEAAGRSRASACWPPRAPRRCCGATEFRATRCASTSRSPSAGPARAVGGRRDPRRRGRHGDQHPVRQLRAAHRRLRDPLGRGVDEHPVRHDGAGRVGGGAGHRGRHPRRHRRDVAAGAAQHAGAARRWAGSVAGWPTRCAHARPAVPGHRPASRSCWRAWGLTADADGLARFCEVCVAAFAGFAVVKPQVAFFEALRRRRVSRCWSAPSPRCGRPACWCSPTPSAATSARRWRPTPTPGPAIRRWRPTP